jgi:hypothetical protein
MPLRSRDRADTLVPGSWRLMRANCAGVLVRHRSTPMIRYGIDWSVFFLAFMFSIVANSYYGWNLMPQSDAELITDGIFLLLVALSFKRFPSAKELPNG